jgi:serine/threonine-protein kinase
LGTQNRDYNSDVAEGSIYFQDPSGGENVEPGSAVDVIVSLGPEQVEVPEVYGLSVAAAQTALSNAGLNSTAIEVEGDEAAGTALSTDPEVGVMLDPGSTVSLYYSAGPPPVTTPSPDPSASSGDASSNPEPEPGPDQGGGENTDAQPAADDRPADRPERDTSPQGNGGPDNSGEGSSGQGSSGQGSSGQGNGTQNNSGSGNGGGSDTNARLGSGSPE